MNRLGNKTFARPHLAYDECRKRALGHLVNLRVDLLHFRRFSDDIVRLETCLEFHCHTFVFGLENFVLFAGLATKLYCCRQHLRDDF